MALLSWINWLDRAGAVLTPTASEPGQGVERLKQPQLRRRWRRPFGTTAGVIQLDMGGIRPVDVMALAQPDDCGGVDADGEAVGWFLPTDGVVHRLSVATETAGDILNTGAIPGGWVPHYGVHTYVTPATLNARYWRCNIDAPSLGFSLGVSDGSLLVDASNNPIYLDPIPQGVFRYLDIGRAWIGPAWRTTGNFAYGWSWSRADASTVQRPARSGLEFVDRGPRVRVVTFAFRSLREQEAKQTVEDLTRIAGISGQVLFIPDPGGSYEGRQAIIGRLAQVPVTSQPNFALYEAAFEIRQSL